MTTALRDGLEAAEQERAALLASLEAMTPNQRVFQPAPDAWSPVQVVLHLALADEGTLVGMRRELEAGKAPGRQPWKTRLGYVLLIGFFAFRMKLRVPVRAIQPDPVVALPEVRRRWDAARTGIVGFFDALPDDRLARPLFRHPVVGWLTPGQTLAFIRRHGRHHRRQVERIAGSPGFPVP
jgi:DinB superfamily